MSAEQGIKTKEGCTTYPTPTAGITLGIHIIRHHRAATQIQWIQCYFIRNWPILKDDLPYSPNHRVINERIDRHIPKTDLEASWNPQEDYKWQRTSVYIQTHEGTLYMIRHSAELIHHLPSPNQWSSWTITPRNRNLPLSLHQPSTGQLGRLACHFRIPV